MSELENISGRPVESINRHHTYISPFESIDYTKAAEALAYNGTLGAVLSELSRVIGEQGQPDKTSLVLHPPRIIRAAIDYKVANPTSQVAQDLVKESLKLGLQVYRDPDQSVEQLEHFKKLVEDGAEDLLTLPLVQKTDNTTWEASHHSRSQRTAEELAAGNTDVLFIALAHGGIAAGMDTYLRYCDMKKSSNSSFYSFRLSHSSTYDHDAQITLLEAEYLKEQSKDRSVIIFDEDQATGSTLEKAEDSISRILNKPVTTIANMGSAAGYFSD